MEGPALKRPKLQLGDLHKDDWLRWSGNLETLQQKLATGCLCNTQTLELQRPIFPAVVEESQNQPQTKTSTTTTTPSDSVVESKFLRDYTLQFISTMNLLSETALKQQAKGFICKRVMDMASGVAMDEGTWEMLIEYLDSDDKFITMSTSKCLVSMLMWTRLPNLNEIFNELFDSVMITTNNPFKLSHILDIIRGVVEYRYDSEHPLELDEENELESQLQNPTIVSNSTNSNDVNMLDISSNVTAAANPPLENPSSSLNNQPLLRRNSSCCKVEVDTEIESEVKTLCVKALENWWGRLLTKFQNMMAHFDPINESPVVTFLSLWLSIISVKNNLSVIDTKHYYMHLEAFLPLLNPNSPAIIWKKLTDVFNEILCYGSTLSLQDVPNEEPCDLAHLIIRCVRSRQFLQGIPYSRAFTGFGGSSFGPVDWDWGSVNVPRDIVVKNIDAPLSKKMSPTPQENPSSSSIPPAIPSSSKSFISSPTAIPHRPDISSDDTKTVHIIAQHPSSEPTPTVRSSKRPSQEEMPQHQKKKNPLLITQTIYIGPSRDAVPLDETFDDNCGDKPLLQKVVLLVLKSVAVTVQETRAEEDSNDDENSSMDGSNNENNSDSEVNDMVFVEKSIREVFRELDLYVKSLLPYHPSSPLAEWMVKLFADQDDALIEAMLCVLDTYRGFLGKIDFPEDFRMTFHPAKSFLAFLNTVSNDKDILLDWLMGNETCFLLYLLRFLKFSFKNWSEFVSCCGRELENTMSVLIRLRMGVGRLVERSLFPYNINPVLRLLERCEELYETGGGNNS